MDIQLQTEIEKFRSFAGLGSAYGSIEPAGPDIIRYSPANRKVGGLKIGFLALVHGNEIIGLPVLNSILADLQSGLLISEHELFFGLGNLLAADNDKRYLEKDLNRCFGLQADTTPEERRAREIETHLLDDVDYLIDLHQTIHPAVSPFFIFQYSSPACLHHLSLMNPGLPTVLQFDAIGGGQGLSTDEYLRNRGRFGVALELGQIGMSEEMFQLGRSICEEFIRKMNSFTGSGTGSGRRFEELNRPASRLPDAPFFEITDVVRAPQNDSRLAPHWRNFMKFEMGEKLGESPQGAIIAEKSGFVLFPKLNQSVNQGLILTHICETLSAAKLHELATGSGIEANHSLGLV